jgi:hypothetical protein
LPWQLLKKRSVQGTQAAIALSEALALASMHTTTTSNPQRTRSQTTEPPVIFRSAPMVVLAGLDGKFRHFVS